jgi:hypothetical protein
MIAGAPIASIPIASVPVFGTLTITVTIVDKWAGVLEIEAEEER